MEQHDVAVDQAISPALRPAGFEGGQPFALQVSRVLAALKAIQLCRLRRPETVSSNQPQCCADQWLIAHTDSRCGIAEAVVTIGDSVVQATAEGAGLAVVAQVAVACMIDVVVVQAFKTKAMHQCKSVSDGKVAVVECRSQPTFHVVVVVRADRTNAGGGTRTRCRFRLCLFHVAV